jgi:hypothetical protein
VDERPSVVVLNDPIQQSPAPLIRHDEIIMEIMSARQPDLNPHVMMRELRKLRIQVSAEEAGHECSICLSNLTQEDQAVRLQCNEGHLFHFECLQKWAHQSYTCPVCRVPIIDNMREIEVYRLS